MNKLLITTCLVFVFGFFVTVCGNYLNHVNFKSEKGIQIDSSKIYNKKAKLYRETEFEKCFYFSQLAYNFADKFNNQIEKSKAVINFGDAYFYQSNYSKALVEYKRALELSRINSLDTLIADNLCNIASVYVETGQLELGVEYYEKSIKIYNQLGDKQGVSNIYNNLGIISLYTNDFDKAVDYFEKSLDIKRNLNNKKEIAEALNNSGVLFLELNHVDKSIALFEEAIENYSELDEKIGLHNVYLNYSMALQAKGKSTEAINLLEKCIKFYTIIQNNKKLSESYNNLGSVYENKAEYEKAIFCYNKTLEFSEGQDMSSAKAHSLNNIANIFLKIDNLDKSLNYYKQALAEFEKLNDSDGIADSYLGLGNIYSNMGMYDKSMKYYLNSLSHFESIGNFERMSSLFQNIGALYEFKNNPDSALFYYYKSLNLKEELMQNEKIAITLQTIATVQKNSGDYYNALKNYELSFGWAKKMDQKDIIVNHYKYVSEVYYEKNDYKQAIDNLFQHISLNDSIRNTEIEKQINEIMTKYETEKIEQENQRLNVENELNRSKLRQQYIITYGIAAVTVFIIIILILLYFQYYNKKKANVALENKNKIISEQKKEITDSIQYARYIQNAMLPSKTRIERILPESFVLYKPKNIVSGDFYWIKEKENKIIFTAADCTGHGVPGAFMSIIGNMLLENTINELTDFNAGDILNSLNEKVNKTLNPEQSNQVINDGMDLAMVVLIENENGWELNFAGAYNPLLIIRDGLLTEVKATKAPIGLDKFDYIKHFENRKIDLQKGDLLYVFSDGFADQFGGSEGKKLKSKNLKQLLIQNHQETMDQQKQFLDSFFEKWKGDYEQVDDVVIFGVKL